MHMKRGGLMSSDCEKVSWSSCRAALLAANIMVTVGGKVRNVDIMSHQTFLTSLGTGQNAKGQKGIFPSNYVGPSRGIST